MRDWDFLDDDLKKSNRNQISYMTQILRAVGCGVAPAGSGAAPGKFSSEEDIYNPKRDAGQTVRNWIAAGGKFRTGEQVTMRHR